MYEGSGVALFAANEIGHYLVQLFLFAVTWGVWSSRIRPSTLNIYTTILFISILSTLLYIACSTISDDDTTYFV